MVAAAPNDIDDEKSIENNCQLSTGCGMENNNFFLSVDRASSDRSDCANAFADNTKPDLAMG